MDHAPQTPADERVHRLIEHANLAADRRAALLALLGEAQSAAQESGSELQAEFGRDHVGLIVGCNQFLRLWRGGAEAGAAELLLPPDEKKALATAGVPLRDPDGAVFKLFGWVRFDPAASAAERAAVRAAFRKAKASAKPS